MPTYEYRCPEGHVFEKFYPKINDRRRVPCPTCGKTAERLISGGTSVVFKGSGFYATDYRKKPSEGESKPAEGGAAQSDKPDKQDKPKKKDSSSDK